MTDAETAPEYLTVRELAQLLRIRERKVYDLAASGKVPCLRATGKLLFPAREIRHWMEGSRSGTGPTPSRRPPIVLGSHDPLLDWAIRESGSRLATYFDGSMDGLERFAGSGGVAAGLHLRDAATETWNVPALTSAVVDQNAALVAFVARSRGLILRESGPRPCALADLAGLRVATRQDGSGTELLFRDLASDAGLPLEAIVPFGPARTETDAAEAVARGEADVTFGLEGVARSHGLAFVPVIEERYDLLVDRAAWFDMPLQTLLGFCRGSSFAEKARSLGGYDVTGFGDVLWNGPEIGAGS